MLRFLHAVGIVAWRQNVGSVVATHKGKERFVQFGRKGMSDVLGIIPPAGKSLAVEIKVPGKDATPEQVAFLSSVRQAGGLAFVAHSCEEVAKELGWS